MSDALYERDCLFYCKFDYDLLVECDLPNKYENMDLPPFPEKRPRGKIKGMTFNKKEKEGEIIFNHKELKFCIMRAGEVFGKYNTLVEAYYYKKIKYFFYMTFEFLLTKLKILISSLIWCKFFFFEKLRNMSILLF